jgi:hypothetical protein
MGMIYKSKEFTFNVIPSQEIRPLTCYGCIYEDYHEGDYCRLNNHLKEKYDFSCSENSSIFVEDPIMILKKL